MDGAIAEFAEGILRLQGSPLESAQIDTMQIWNHLGISEDAMWDSIHSQGSDFWAALPRAPSFDTIVPAVRRAGVKVSILTQPSSCPSSRVGKLEWLRRHGLGDLDVHFAEKHGEKSRFGHPESLLIDDFTHNIEGFVRNGGHGLIIPRPWTAPLAQDLPHERIRILHFSPGKN